VKATGGFMRKLVLVASGLAAVLALGCAAAARPDDGFRLDKWDRWDHDATTILVRFASAVDAAQQVAAAGDEDISKVNGRVDMVRIKDGSDLDAKLAEYRGRSDVLYAEANYIAYAQDLPNAPNDQSYGQQWAYGKIQATAGWTIYPKTYSAHATSAEIAVIDTGVQSDHPDLSGQIDTNNAANCINSLSTCSNASAADDNGHGTHVSGIAAAATNNTTGVAGAAFSSLVMPIKVLTSSGSGTYAAITNGITWAVVHGANVISMSLGGSAYSQTLCDAITNAISKGVVVVVAAGNSGSSAASYPAACPGSIGVAATDSNDATPGWSNYDSPNVFVSAPGVSVYSTYPTNGYATLSGTSMATPFVSALAALLLGEDSSRTPADVKTILATTSDKVGGGYGSDPYGTCAGCTWSPSYGYGRINMYRALNYAPPPATADFSLGASPSSRTVITGGSTSYTVSVSGTNGFNGSVNLSLSGLPAGASGSFSGPASPGSSSTLSVSSGTAAAGTYSFTITGTFGSLSHQTSATLVVQPQGDFTLSTSPTSTSIRRGNSTSYAIAINRVGNFADPVSFSVGGLPSGASASFNPASTTGTSSTLSIGTSFRAQRGSFYLTITGTAAGGVTRTAQVTLSIR
jgi:thermitase